MGMVTKGFSHSLFKKSDAPAKQAMISYLESKGKKVRLNSERFGVDLIVGKGKLREVGYEVEIKYGWKDGSFPFEDLNIPQRKGKFLSSKVVFCVLSADLKRALLVKGENVKEELLAEVSNKYIRSGELFYKIPLCHCKEIKLC